jgi:heat-inducible transcriptional repressor
MSREDAKEDKVRMLPSRDRAILRDVVSQFILTGEPVSSRVLAKSERHGVSAATIRNVMADLEELGLLSHPHTSAGRVPTEEGYHVYIDSLMPSRGISVRHRAYIDRSLERKENGDKLLDSASQLLSELSNQIAIVVTPIGDTTVRAIDFVKLSERRVLCVVVSGGGFIDNKVIETAADFPREELVRISNYVNHRFAGRSVREIRNRLLELMAEERAAVDELLANAIQLADRAFASDQQPALHFEGTASLLALPELGDLERVRRLLDTFADKASLVQMLSQLIEGPGVRVVIGEESELTSPLDFSLVATSFGVGETRGSLGVFGPSRMEYQKMIPLVDYFGERLSRALEQVYSDDSGRVS